MSRILPMYRRARLGIGYLPQEASIFRTLSVEANIMSILQLVESDREAQRDKLENLLQEFSVTHVRKSAGGALSGGERRRVEIARALASDPSFILLDEPFAGIDPIAISDIRELVAQLKDRGLGVLITDHNVRETLSIIDRAVIMHDGQVLTEGTAEEIVNNEAVRAHYLGDDFTLHEYNHAYAVKRLFALLRGMVEPGAKGIEPPTSCMPCKRSPN